MEIYKKIAKAKEEIKSTDLKKDGRNEYSKYNYFNPEQIENLVFNACRKNSLMTKFDLKRNEFGEYGTLTIIDIETGETAIYEMATATPEIKATNVTQQLGGCVTYTERYLKMTAFGIVENSLDFDDKKHPEKAEPKETKPKDDKPWLNPNTSDWENVKHSMIFGYTDKNNELRQVSMDDVKKKYLISKTNESKLLTEIK